MELRARRERHAPWRAASRIGDRMLFAGQNDTAPRPGTHQAWVRRRGAVAFVVVLLVPLVFGLLVASAVYVALPPPQDLWQVVLYWLVLSLVATLAARGFERAAVRLLPISTLVRLSVLLNDRRLERAVREADEPPPAPMTHELWDHAQRLLAQLGNEDRARVEHARRTGALVALLADRVGLAPDDRHRLVWATRLYPVVAAAPERQPTAATLGPLADWLGEFVVAIEQLDERWDGTGSPDGLAGRDINLGSRLMAVAVMYDRLVTEAPRLATDDARHQLSDMAGSRLDPAAVRAFLALPVRRLRLVLGPLSVAVAASEPGAISRLTNLAPSAAPAAAVGAGVLVATVLANPVVTDAASPEPSAIDRPVAAAPQPAASGADLAVPDLTFPLPRPEPSRPPQQEVGVDDPPPTEVLGVTIERPDPPATAPDPVSAPDPVRSPPPAPPASEDDPPASPPDLPTDPETVPAPQPPTPTAPEEAPPPTGPTVADGDPVTIVIGEPVGDEGGAVTWTIVVTNVSDEPLTGVQLTLRPPGARHDRGSAEPGPQGRYDLGDIAPGGSVTLTFSAHVSDHASPHRGPDAHDHDGTPGSSVLVVTVRADGIAPVRITSDLSISS